MDERMGRWEVGGGREGGGGRGGGGGGGGRGLNILPRAQKVLGPALTGRPIIIIH